MRRLFYTLAGTVAALALLPRPVHHAIEPTPVVEESHVAKWVCAQMRLDTPLFCAPVFDEVPK